MESARRFLGKFNLVEAIGQFESCLAKYPNDAEMRKKLDAITLLSNRLAAHEAEIKDPVLALLRLGDDLAETYRIAWHRRLATEAQQQHGPGCDIAGTPVGLHWLAAGELKLAAQSLRESLRATPDNARLLAYLRDVRFLENKVRRARVHYLHAFLLDPADVNLAHIADSDVKNLVSVAENDYGIRGDCVD